MRPTFARFFALWGALTLVAGCSRGVPPLNPAQAAEVLEASGAAAGALAACLRARDELCVRHLAALLERAEALP